jgi:hypothetical protein
MQAPVLTRIELERMAMHMRLDQNAERVQIIQKSNSGIGNCTHARFYYQDGSYHEIEVTDIGVW